MSLPKSSSPRWIFFLLFFVTICVGYWYAFAPKELSDTTESTPFPTNRFKPMIVKGDSDRCPEDMTLVHGGKTVVVYFGERWGGSLEVETKVDDFCIDIYEASQPDATASSQGAWFQGNPNVKLPMAKSTPGVLPWINITWANAQKACGLAGKQLPTLAQWQTAYSGYKGAPWPWGKQWRENSCYTSMSAGVYPTGGCCFKKCFDEKCFTTCDMMGNVSEWVDGYWDEKCYGKEQFLVAGGSAHISYLMINHQVLNNEKEGCWKFVNYMQQRAGLHHHSKEFFIEDDGFRCAKEPLPAK